MLDEKLDVNKDETSDLRPDLMAISEKDVYQAATNIKGAVKHTPFTLSKTLSTITGAELWLKFEIFQFTAAYKERGALNKLLSLQSPKGVIAMSAGNHAQGLSYHAGRLGIPATIVMPNGTPFNKVKRTEELGAHVILAGNTLEEALAAANIEAKRYDLTLVHPFDDPKIIAGQGTVGLEMMIEQPDLDILIVPVGGGGLIAGMAMIAKSLNPNIRIIGVQTEAFPSMREAMTGETLGGSRLTIAEGIAVMVPGTKTQRIVKEYVDEILIVPEARIEAALVLIMEVEKVVIEGAAAISLAAMMQHPKVFSGKKVGMVLTGGNIDSRMLASAIMRGMARDGRLSRLRISMPDTPGSLATVTNIVSRIGANVIEVRHQREFGALSLKMTEMELVVETKDQAHAQDLFLALEESGFAVSAAKTV